MLKIRNLSKTYHTKTNDITVLKDIDLDLHKGEFAAIIGHSGSGKSTLLHLIGGLDQPSTGTILLDGEDISNYNDKKYSEYRNKKVGFVFQQFNLISRLNVLENVELVLKLSGVNYFFRRKRAKKLLELVGLKRHMYKKPSKLSGGEKQRVAIARALANDPDIIIADEPTGSLDSETAENIMKVLREISNSGKLVIVVSHDEGVKKWSTRIIELEDGKKINDSRHRSSRNTDQIMLDNMKINTTRKSLVTAISLAVRSLLGSFFRNFIMIIAISLSIAVILSMISINKGLINRLIKTQSEIVDRPDLIDVQYTDNVSSKDNYNYSEIISYQNQVDADIDFISNIENVKDVYYKNIYSFGFSKITYEDQTNYSDYTFKIVPYYEQYSPRILYGEFPQNENEVMVSLNYIKHMYGLSRVDGLSREKILNLIGTKITVLFSDNYQKSNMRKFDETNDFNYDEWTIEREYTISGIKYNEDYIRITMPYEALVKVNGEYYKDSNDNEKWLNVYQGEAIQYHVFASTVDKYELEDISDKITKYNSKFLPINEVVKLQQLIDFVSNVKYVVYGFISLSILISILMIGIVQYLSVLRRKKEIGVLKAIGATRKDIMLTFIIESALITIIAAILSRIIAGPISERIIDEIYAYFRSSGFSPRESLYFTQIRITFGHFNIVFLVSILIGLLSGLIPSLKASRFNPIEILRYE